MSQLVNHIFFRTISVLVLCCAVEPLAAAEDRGAANPAASSSDVPALDALPAPDVLPIPDANATKPSVSQNVTLNLINRLVKKGVLSKEDADDLVKLAEADAAAARTQQQADVQAVVAKELAEPVSEDEVRVSYVPEAVKNQMRDEIKADVFDQARREKWGAANTTPGWVSKLNLFGDFRLRYEGMYFPIGNDNSGAFPNFNAINTGAPFDVSGTQFSPQLNADQNRERIRLRARMGAEINLDDGFTTGFRLATGENNSPVSPNQTFGAAGQGQGGDFSKYAIWLDRAYLRYNFGDKPYSDIDLYFGRFDNPFFSSDVMWYNDIGFDGFATKGKFEVTDSVKSFVTLGAFPVFNTDLNFSSNQPAKMSSTDKWLYGAQIGIDWKIRKDLTAKVAVAYYDFQNIAGRLSSPFTPLTTLDAGNTDNTRPAFAQKGNTYMALRDIVPTAANGYGTTLQYQYFGLATPFRDLAVTGRLDYDGYEPFRLSLVGEYIKNLAFNQGAVAALAVNNRGPGKPGVFEGGDTAWILNLQVGDAALEKFGDWNAYLGYRYVESDAVVDGFTDSDFGGGGTNMKGFTIGANMAISKAVRVGLRWMSADQIAGPALKSDILQFDLNAKF